jgi:hypothetical protein
MANKSATSPEKRNNAVVMNATSDGSNINILERHWPEEFTSPRRALFLAAASVLVAAMVFPAASLGGFTAFKISLAQWMELTTPDAVSPANFDVATILWVMSTTLFLGLIHPSLGIGLLLVLRPWLDGYTFFSDNVYFTWGIYFLCAFWLIKVIKQRKQIYAPAPALILALLMVVYVVVTRYSYQYFNTYQHLWLWLGYAALFMLTLNATRNKSAWGVVLTVFLFGVGLQALFSILHFEYLLPHLRRVIQDPAMLQRYFGTNTINPEMARRFNVNRAFGSMLFPNALAAYMLLAIPIAFVGVKIWWRNAADTLNRKNNAPATAPVDRAILLAVAIALGIGCFVAVFFVTHFPREYVYKDSLLATPTYLKTAPLTILAFIFACSTALAMLLAITRYGLDGIWYLFRFTGVCLLAPLLLYTLWITYSRGAYLGLFFASLWSIFLLIITPAQARQLATMVFRRKNAATALIVLLFFAATALFLMDVGDSASYAQPADGTSPENTGPPQPVDPRTVVREEGISLTATDLADPASLRLRFGYWRVAVRMAMDNLLTGVGLGNFAIAYPAYQYIGAGDVREAHNGFLQIFAETGFLGGLLFFAFWAYFGIWGSWRIINEKDKHIKLLLLGMYTGIVAFCGHAFLDINFSHPSLVMFAMVYAGLFYSKAAGASASDEESHTAEEEALSPTPQFSVNLHRLTAAALLVLLLVGTAAVFRAWGQQLVLSRFSFINISQNSELELSKRMRTGQFYLAELPRYAELISQGQKPPSNPRIAIPLARLFLPEYEAFSGICVFYKPAPDRQNRFLRLEEGEPIPDNGLMMVGKQAYYVRDCAMENIAAWIEELKRVDRIFPHHHELALNIIKWYELHIDHTRGETYAEALPIWVSEYLKWSRILMQRNPHHADVRMFHAQALLRVALLRRDETCEELMAQALEEWQVVMDLTPITTGHKHAYAAALASMGDYYKENGRNDLAAEMRDKAEEMRLKALDMQEQRIQAQLYP